MTKKQPTAKRSEATVADVLHYAADNCLLSHSRYGEGGSKEKFSCCAVDEAVYRITGQVYGGESCKLRRRVIDGLRNMGCETGSSTLFKKHGDSPDDHNIINHKVQGMRYMWLKWAALMAEEQGV